MFLDWNCLEIVWIIICMVAIYVMDIVFPTFLINRNRTIMFCINLTIVNTPWFRRLIITHAVCSS